MPAKMQLYNRERCHKRSRLAARKGFEAVPVRLYGSAPPGMLDSATIISARGSLPTGEAAIARINELLASEKPLTAEQVHVKYLEAGNTNYISSRVMFLAPSTLKNIARTGDEGFAFMNSHRTGGLSSDPELPMGRTFAGRYERLALNNGQTFGRTLLGFYMLRGEFPNGTSQPGTDAMAAGIDGGTIFDVSLGLDLYPNHAAPATLLCDICGEQLDAIDAETGRWLCPHIPGTTRAMSDEQQQAQVDRGVSDGVATYSIHGASAGEISAVFDGAVPGAGFRRALSAARSGQLSSAEMGQFRRAYANLLETNHHGGVARRTLNPGRRSPAASLAKGTTMPRLSLAALRSLLGSGHVEIDDDDDESADIPDPAPRRLSGGAIGRLSTGQITEDPPKPAPVAPEVLELQQQLKDERAERQRERREAKLSAIDADIDATIAGEKQANRVNGEQIPKLRQSLRQAAIDDLDHPIEGFSRLGNLKAVQASSANHGKTNEVVIDPKTTTTLSNSGDSERDPIEAARTQNEEVLGKPGANGSR